MNIDLSKTQKYINWMSTKIFLDSNSSSAKKRMVKRGEVYWCNFGYNVGSEMSKSTPRPCVIIQNDIANIHSGCTIVCPITHNNSKKPYLIPLPVYTDNNGNTLLDGNVSAANIICISKARLGGKILPSRLDNQLMKTIDNAVASQLGLTYHYKKLLDKYNSKLAYINILKQQRNDAQDSITELLNISGTASVDDLKKKLKNTT